MITISSDLLPSLDINHIVWDDDLSIALDSSNVTSTAETSSFSCGTIEFSLECYDVDSGAYVDCDTVGDNG